MEKVKLTLKDIDETIVRIDEMMLRTPELTGLDNLKQLCILARLQIVDQIGRKKSS